MKNSKTLKLESLRQLQFSQGDKLWAESSILLEKGRPKRQVVIVLSSLDPADKDSQLRRENLISLVQDLPRQESLPGWLIFRNETVKLLTEDSPILGSLVSLSDQGTLILACQNSLSRLDLASDLASFIKQADSHEINSCLLAADLVISY